MGILDNVDGETVVSSDFSAMGILDNIDGETVVVVIICGISLVFSEVVGIRDIWDVESSGVFIKSNISDNRSSIVLFRVIDSSKVVSDVSFIDCAIILDALFIDFVLNSDVSLIDSV